MPKHTYYLKHDANASSDIKMKALRRHYGWEGSGWYWYIAELMRVELRLCLLYSDLTFDALADEFRCDSEKVKKFIDDCISPKIALFKKNGNYFFSERLMHDAQDWEAKREQKREAGRISAEKRRMETPSGKAKREDRPKAETEDKPDETFEQGDELQQAYGEFNNVLLTSSEYEKLVGRFGKEKTSELIEELSTAMKSKGLKYKSHYATILNWERRDNGANRKGTKPDAPRQLPTEYTDPEDL